MTFTHPDHSRIAAAQIGDEAAMCSLLADYKRAREAAVAARVKAGHERDDARQLTDLAFIEAVQAHDLRKSSTLAGYIARALRVGIARPTALAVPPGTLARFRALMRAHDFDEAAALAEVDAGAAQMTRGTFLAIRDAISARSMSEQQTDREGEPIPWELLGRPAIAAAADPRLDASLGALDLLDPLQRSVIRLRLGLDELHDARGRRVQISKVSWLRIGAHLDVSTRDVRTAYRDGIAALRR